MCFIPLFHNYLVSYPLVAYPCFIPFFLAVVAYPLFHILFHAVHRGLGGGAREGKKEKYVDSHRHNVRLRKMNQYFQPAPCAKLFRFGFTLVSYVFHNCPLGDQWVATHDTHVHTCFIFRFLFHTVLHTLFHTSCCIPCVVPCFIGPVFRQRQKTHRLNNTVRLFHSPFPSILSPVSPPLPPTY